MSKKKSDRPRLRMYQLPHTTTLLKNAAAIPSRLRAEEIHDNEDTRPRGTTNQNLRKRLFEKNPLCAKCQALGITRQWDELDHIVPLHKGGHPTDESNLQGLCYDHHREKTIEDSKS